MGADGAASIVAEVAGDTIGSLLEPAARAAGSVNGAAMGATIASTVANAMPDSKTMSAVLKYTSESMQSACQHRSRSATPVQELQDKSSDSWTDVHAMSPSADNTVQLEARFQMAMQSLDKQARAMQQQQEQLIQMQKQQDKRMQQFEERTASDVKQLAKSV